MSFDWNEFHLVAQDLVNVNYAGTAGQEARQRAAISRAYYAVFCVVRNYLCAKERDPTLYIPARCGNPHSQVRKDLQGKHGQPKIAKQIGELHEKRKRADYDDSISKPASEVEDALNLARKILNEIAGGQI